MPHAWSGDGELGLDLFAEAPGRAFIVSGLEAALTGLEIIGSVGGGDLRLGEMKIAVSELAAARDRGLARYL